MEFLNDHQFDNSWQKKDRKTDAFWNKQSPSSHFNVPYLGEELAMEHKFLNHLLEKTGLDPEYVISKKEKSKKGEPHFSSMLKLGSDLIGNADTEKLLTKKFGWDPERAFKEVSMPKFDLSYQKSHDIMLGRNIDMNMFF